MQILAHLLMRICNPYALRPFQGRDKKQFGQLHLGPLWINCIFIIYFYFIFTFLCCGNFQFYFRAFHLLDPDPHLSSVHVDPGGLRLCESMVIQIRNIDYNLYCMLYHLPTYFYELLSWLGTCNRASWNVKTKEYISVIEGTAPPFVFQTFAHSTSSPACLCQTVR